MPLGPQTHQSYNTDIQHTSLLLLCAPSPPSPPQPPTGDQRVQRDITTHLIVPPALPSPLFFCFLRSQPHRSSDSGCSTREITDQTATVSTEAKGKCRTNTVGNTLQLVITTAFILIKAYISYR